MSESFQKILQTQIEQYRQSKSDSFFDDFISPLKFIYYAREHYPEDLEVSDLLKTL